jgi:hypothetical protein
MKNEENTTPMSQGEALLMNVILSLGILVSFIVAA